MAWRRSSIQDPMRYIRKTPAGKYQVRIWINVISSQVYCGTFPTLVAAQAERDLQERKCDIHNPCKIFKIFKPRAKKKPQPDLYSSNI